MKRLLKWASFLLIAGTAHATFSGYNYERPIVISTSSVSSGTLTYNNFIFPVSFFDISISTLAGVGHMLTGYDLIFSSSSNCSSKLRFEQEAPNFNGFTQYNAWVQDTLSSATATTLYMCYGNSAIVTPQYTSTGTWTSDYDAVYHLQNGTTLSAVDSTSNGNNGSITSVSATTGQIDGGANFTTINTSVIVAKTAPLVSTSANASVSMWVNFASEIGNGGTLYSERALSGNDIWKVNIIQDAGGDVAQFVHRDDAGTLTFINGVGAALNDRKWHFIELTKSGTSVVIYVDGSFNVSGTLSGTNNFTDSGLQSWIGLDQGDIASDSYVGSMDEVEISTVVKSADFVKTQYNSIAKQATFSPVGAESPVTPNTMTVTVAGKTATQAILTYNAPDNNLCGVLVSVSSVTYAPVHDIDSSLFSGSLLDNRTGALVNGQSRIFVVGKRASELANDGNYYSRALQTLTTYYVKIVCDSQTGTTSFTTNNIPLGDTHNEALPVDPNHPGTYAYPTLSDSDRSQQIVDSKTGLLIRRFEVLNDYTSIGSNPQGPPADHIDLCGQTPYTDTSGNTGFYCMLPTNTLGDVYFINSKTGQVNDLGNPVLNYPFYYNCIAQGFDQKDPRSWYCSLVERTGAHPEGLPVVVKATYTGDDSPVSHGSTMVPVTYTDLTPANSGQDLYTLFSLFDSSINFASDVGLQPSGFQDGAMLFHLLRNGGQDSYGYMMSFAVGDGTAVGTSTSSAHVQAVTDTYSRYPMRWCAIHVFQGYPTGNYNGYVQPQCNPLDFGNGINPGGGPYWTNITSINGNGSRTLLAPTDVAACPAGNPFVIPGEVSCSTITVSQQPSLPSPGAGVAPSLQNVAPGDILDINDAGPNADEHFQVISVSSLTWVIRRPNPKVFTHGTSQLEAECGLYDITPGNEGFHSQGAVWDTINDPYGIGGTTTIKIMQTFTPNHFDYRPNAAVISGGNYIVAIGTFPQVTQSAPELSISQFPAFDGQAGYTNGNQINSHPAISLGAPSFFDGRPYFGSSTNGPGEGAVGGQLYKFQSGAWGGGGTDISPLRPDILDTYAYCGDFPLLDVSGPSTSMSTGTASNYEYCIAKKANECWSGSAVGDVYVNCPGVTTTQCTNTGGATANYISASITDICIISPSPYMMQTVEMSTTTNYFNGEYGRRLTNTFNWYRRMNVFGSMYGINNEQQGIFYSVTAGESNKTPGANNNYGSSLAFLANIPPLASTDTLNRSTYIPITLNLTPPVANVNNALVQYGYAEYGPQTSYYCTSRQETCVSVSSYVVSATPITYAQTDTYSGKACSSGCTITIPALPQHTTYMNVVYRDASNNVLATQQGVSSEINTAFLGSGASVPTFNDAIIGPQRWIGPSKLK